MKKIFIYIIVIAVSLLYVTCSSDDDNKRTFVLNINGVDYRYSVVASYRSDTPDEDNRYIEIYGQSNETKAFASCMIGVSYKVQGEGTYRITDYQTLAWDLYQNTDNKYVYIHVNLGSDEGEVSIDKNIVRYGTSDDSGTVDVEVDDEERYNFYIGRTLELIDTGDNEGTRPEGAPNTIQLKLDKAYF